MSEDKKVPKLRFPGFTDDWEKYNIDQIFNFISTNSFSRKYLNDNKGEVKNIHYGDIHTKFPTIVDCSTEYIPFINENVNLSKIKPEQYCKNGDLIIADASEDYEDIGKPIELTNIDGIKIISGLHTILLRDNSKNTVLGFKGYYFSNPKLKKQIKIIANGISVLGIGKNDLSKISIKIPCKSEQEKIVKFLFKIDKKIIFLKSNLDNCQKFKKYLLQNLFPKNNESAPKLRFKNENGGNYSGWNEEFLGDITDICTGKKDLKDNDPNGLYPFFVRSSKIERIDTYSYDGEAILIPGDGKIGEVFHYINGKFDYHQRVYKISDFKNVNGKYIYYYLQKNFLKHALKYSAKATVDSLRLPIIKEMKIRIPQLEEQNKIAILLSTIDNRIDLIQNQINKTEEFKKGLLQQMFEFLLFEFLFLIFYKYLYDSNPIVYLCANFRFISNLIMNLKFQLIIFFPIDLKTYMKIK